MSELTVTVLRFALFALLWLFVFLVAAVLRQDLFSMRPAKRRRRKSEQVAQQSAPRPVPVGAGGGQPNAPPSRLAVTQGNLRGAVVALGQVPITIGRSQDSTLVLSDDFASTYHARIVPSQGDWYLEDLGSTNGTIVDGARVTSPVRLSVGQPVTIGHTVLELQS